MSSGPLDSATGVPFEEALSVKVPRYAHGSRVPGWDDAVDLDKPPAEIPDPAQTEVPRELRAQIQMAMARYPDRRSAAIPALHAAQMIYGWCSPEAIEQVAAVMQLTPAFLASVATFYDMLSTVPVGRNAVFVCTNISCRLNGAEEIYDAMLSAAGDDPDFHVRSFECLGACDLAPMASVNGMYVGPLTTEDCREVIAACQENREVLPEKSLARRLSVNPDSQRRADTGGLGATEPDRPGPTAAIELTQTTDDLKADADEDEDSDQE